MEDAVIITPPNSSELKAESQLQADDLSLPGPMVPVKSRQPRRNHSEIERRRRQRLNSKYNELRELVPNCRAFRFAKRGGDAGLHKLDILTEAVDYIKELTQRIEEIPTVKVESNPMVPSAHSHTPLAAPIASRVPPPVLPPQAEARTAMKHNISYLIN